MARNRPGAARRLDPARASPWLRPLAADARPDPRGARHLGRRAARARRQSARTTTATCCSAGCSRPPASRRRSRGWRRCCCIAASLIVAFRAGIWNLGGDGQFLLGAGHRRGRSAPLLVAVMPGWLTLVLCLALAAVVGAVWSLLPALLRAYQGVNEIITTLMMTFLGISLANVLVKLAFLDPATTVPQTRTLPVEDRLPRLFGTTVSSGLLIGLVAIIVVHLDDDAHGLRPEAAGRRRQRARRRPCRPAGAAPDGRRLRHLGGAGRACRRGRDPRRAGQCAGGLEPGLRTGRHPARLPGALQRLCLDRLRLPVLGAVDRRRERRAPARRAQLFHAGRRVACC